MFYRQLLRWTTSQDEGDWVVLQEPGGGARLSFQTEANFVAPVWPEDPGGQQMMMHLDIGVDELAEGVLWAVECGASVASHQPQDDVRVMIDPVGHPFCLFETTLGE